MKNQRGRDFGIRGAVTTAARTCRLPEGVPGLRHAGTAFGNAADEFSSKNTHI
jgi:hypothetical protein